MGAINLKTIPTQGKFISEFPTLYPMSFLGTLCRPRRASAEVLIPLVVFPPRSA